MTREQDVKIAELVMGWTRVRDAYPGSNMGPVFRPSQEYIEREFRYTGRRILDCTAEPFTTDESADGLVRKFVRENWSESRLIRFADAMRDRLDARWEEAQHDRRFDPSIGYICGDWSLTALAVVEAEANACR